MFVKICGLTTSAAIETAVEAGADALGFVFAKSPRQVTPEQADALIAAAPDDITTVAVMLHPSQEEVDAVFTGFDPEWLQTDAADFDDLLIDKTAEILPVFRSGPSAVKDVLGMTADYEGPLLFESGVSGQGEVADWEQAAEIASQRMLMLAGGLSPDNVAKAVEQVRPWGVDVSSGVESERGVKDLGLIKAFIQAARSV